jgi:hypothetical protein
MCSYGGYHGTFIATLSCDSMKGGPQVINACALNKKTIGGISKRDHAWNHPTRKGQLVRNKNTNNITIM